jgi:ubiquinone/menaquinone biosynthesis C-methylase UbiE
MCNSKCSSQDKIAEISFFSNMVKEDKVAQICPWNKNKLNRALKYLARMVIIKKNIKVLDLGCGPGDFTQQLITMGFDNVIGIDICKDLLEINHRRNPEANLICGDAEVLPFKDVSFDIVICTFVLHHFRIHEIIMNEVYRVLKPAGIFLSVEPNSWNIVTWWHHNVNGKKDGKYEDSVNEKIFSPRYVKQLLRQWFDIVEYKTINFDFVRLLTPFEYILEHMPVVNMFGGSIVVTARKR